MAEDLTYRNYMLQLGRFEGDLEGRYRALALNVDGKILMEFDDAVAVELDPHRFWQDPEQQVGGPLGRLRQRSANRNDLFEIGKALCELALPAGTKPAALFDGLRSDLGPREGLRLQLYIRPPELQTLPWEYLLVRRQEEDQEADFLSLDRQISVVRAHAIDRDPPDPPRRPSLRLAGVASETPQAAQMQLAPIDVAADRKAIDEALAAVNESAGTDLIVSDWVGGTREQLARLLSSPADIFYFAGHGGFQSGPGGFLFMSRADGTIDRFSATDLAVALSNASVRLAILAACDTGRRARLQWHGIAPALINQAVPAVVGNQSSISDSSARVIATWLTKRLLEHVTIDQALSEARLQLHLLGTSDWGVPVLYLHRTEGALFPELLEPSPEQRPFQERTATLADVPTSVVAKRAVARSPYPGIRYFRSHQSDRFFGRDREIETIVEAIETDDAVVVVAGPPGSGKTSAVLAGLSPRLDRAIIRLDQYPQLDEDLAAALQDALPDVAPLRNVGAAAELLAPYADRVALCFDQAERSLEGSLPTAGAERLAGLVAAARRHHIPVIVASRDHAVVGVEAAIRTEGLATAPVALERLTIDAARSAIAMPVESTPVSFADGVVERILLDLDGLRSDEPGRIDPTELQIVCDVLFHRARERNIATDTAAVIDDDVYGAGAEPIIFDYFEQELRRAFAADPDGAEQVLQRFLTARGSAWLSEAQLPDRADVRSGLQLMIERLVRSGFLVERYRETRELALASPAVERAAELWAGPEARRVRRAHGVLDGVWSDWRARRVTARSGQLDYLAAVEGLRPSASEAMLLLRSAVAAGKDPRPWTEHLAGHAAAIKALEHPEVAPDEQTPDLTLVARDAAPGQSLSAIAAKTPHPVDRDTAALTLSVLPGFASQLEEALAHSEQRHRRARVWSALRDVDAESEPTLGLGERAVAWRTTAVRRVRREASTIGWLTAGGALGAVLLALYRALLAPQTTSAPNAWARDLGLQFVLTAFTLAAMTLGMAVATAAGGRRADDFRTWRAVVGGAVGFGIATLGVTYANGLDPLDRPWLVVLGFIAGVLLVVAVTVGRRRGGMVAAIALAGAGFAILRLVARELVDRGAPLSVTRSGEELGITLTRNASGFVESTIEGWGADAFDWLAVADAAMVGGLLAAGWLLGIGWADRRIAKQRKLEAGVVD